MTTARKYVRCKFREGDARSYTYHWDGEDLAPGDIVKIADRDGLGMQKVFVDEIMDEKPSFPTKPILHRHVDESTELDLGDDTDLHCTLEAR